MRAAVSTARSGGLLFVSCVQNIVADTSSTQRATVLLERPEGDQLNRMSELLQVSK